MEILHYQVNLDALFETQNKQAIALDQQKKEYEAQGLENKKELLKHVLPFMHGVYALHNHKCNRTTSSSTGRDGLLGFRKLNIEEELERIVKIDSHLMWKDNYQTFVFTILNKEIKIWLNKQHGAHKNTPHLPYSMTTPFPNKTYGDSVEAVLTEIAKYCARYTDEW